MDKKGQGISMTYIVIAALALIVLIVIVLFFTGGMETMFKKITETTGGQDNAIAISQCRLYCTTNNEAAWDAYETEDGKKCGGLLTKASWKDDECTLS